MSTRSMIAIHQKDGDIRSVYCHWDGYLEHNGVILYNFYDTPEKVNNLIDHGAMSYLGSEIGKKHDFSKSYYGCTFYHRDRQEDKDIHLVKVNSGLTPYINLYKFEEEYNYIFVEETKTWLVKKYNDTVYRKLEDMLKKIDYSNGWIVDVSNEEQYEKMCNFYKKFGKNVEIPKFEEVKYEI